MVISSMFKDLMILNEIMLEPTQLPINTNNLKTYHILSHNHQHYPHAHHQHFRHHTDHHHGMLSADFEDRRRLWRVQPESVWSLRIIIIIINVIIKNHQRHHRHLKTSHSKSPLPFCF